MLNGQFASASCAYRGGFVNKLIACLLGGLGAISSLLKYSFFTFFTMLNFKQGINVYATVETVKLRVLTHPFS